MLNQFKKIVYILVIFSLFTVESSASDNLTKAQRDAFLTIITNYILSDVVDKDAPVFTSPSSVEVAENQTNAYRVVVNDISSVTFSILDGDSDLFNIDASTGVITFKDAPDFETRDTYSFIVQATDSHGNSSTQSVTIHIRDLPEVGKPKKTMQRISYRAGDDGDYQKGITPSYTRNDATGVVTDHVTGFQWQDNENKNTGTYADDAIDYCKYLSLDGGGWRLPTVHELLTITEKGKSNPALDTAVFKNYALNYYWTIDKKGSTYYHLGVDSRTGEVNAFIGNVRCVR